MPITLTVPEGLLSPEAEAEAFAGLTDALLKGAQLSGNSFMTPNVVGHIQLLPRAHMFSGGSPALAAFIELKLPSIALATPEAKRAFIAEATTVVERAAAGKLRRDHIWVNIVYAADGAWGIDGRGYDNQQLSDAIQGKQ